MIFKIKTTTEVTDERVADLLVSALEGGSNFWYILTDYHAPDNYTSYRVSPDRLFPHIDYPMNLGGYLMIGDTEEPEREPIKLDRGALQKGLRTMAKKYPKQFQEFMSAEDDANTGDLFLQCCLFGELIYG